MICKTCREDIPKASFDLASYDHSQRHMNYADCLECAGLSKTQRARRTAIWLLANPAIVVPKSQKAKQKRLSKKQRKAAKKNSTEKTWAKMNLAEKCASMLQRQTPSELKVSAEMEKQKIDFTPQVRVGSYFVDFQMIPHLLAVEIDGEYHFKPEQIEADEKRTKDLKKLGWKVIRFTNEEVRKNLGGVVWEIRRVIGEVEHAVTKKKTARAPRLDRFKIKTPAEDFLFGANVPELYDPRAVPQP